LLPKRVVTLPRQSQYLLAVTTAKASTSPWRCAEVLMIEVQPILEEAFMEQIIKKPFWLRLRRSSLIGRLLGNHHQRPAPASQWEIDRLAMGWERQSNSTRAKMARIGI
jgi:hypothetical protein